MEGSALERNRRRIDRIREPEFLHALAKLDDRELRSRRRMCAEVEHELSYQRRLVHARLDLLDMERRRRAGEGTRSLVETLAETLGDGSVAAVHVTAATRDDTAPVTAGRRQVDRILDDGLLGRLGELDGAAIDRLAVEASTAEEALSRQRRSVHIAIDALDDELSRRYREGRTSVDDLFTA